MASSADDYAAGIQRIYLKECGMDMCLWQTALPVAHSNAWHMSCACLCVDGLSICRHPFTCYSVRASAEAPPVWPLASCCLISRIFRDHGLHSYSCVTGHSAWLVCSMLVMILPHRHSIEDWPFIFCVVQAYIALHCVSSDFCPAQSTAHVGANLGRQ